MKSVCLAYSGFVIGVTSFSLGAVAAAYVLSDDNYRTYGIVLGRAGELALLSDLLSLLLGVAICTVSRRVGGEVPRRLIRCTFWSFLLCVITLVSFPAIAAP
jgi:hypothetical protein